MSLLGDMLGRVAGCAVHQVTGNTQMGECAETVVGTMGDITSDTAETIVISTAVVMMLPVAVPVVGMMLTTLLGYTAIDHALR